jgi:hypothetical protein
VPPQRGCWKCSGSGRQAERGGRMLPCGTRAVSGPFRYYYKAKKRIGEIRSPASSAIKRGTAVLVRRAAAVSLSDRVAEQSQNLGLRFACDKVPELLRSVDVARGNPMRKSSLGFPIFARDLVDAPDREPHLFLIKGTNGNPAAASVSLPHRENPPLPHLF